MSMDRVQLAADGMSRERMDRACKGWRRGLDLNQQTKVLQTFP
jgi:hypothetical protein